MRNAHIRVWSGLILLLGHAGVGAIYAAAQSNDPTDVLIDLYRTARLRVEAEGILARRGVRVKPFPLERLPWVAEDVRKQMAALEALRRPPPPAIHDIRLVSSAETDAFDASFGDTKWAYLGSNERIPADTMRTRDLRALLEAHFGPPTRTVAEQVAEGQTPPEEYIQFEYRFVLNDAIPLALVDVNGPFERGLVTMTDRKYRDRLPEFKAALLDPALQTGVRAPYADYYYVRARQSWFLTGFDGERFFLERIPVPDMKQGRPSLNTESDR